MMKRTVFIIMALLLPYLADAQLIAHRNVVKDGYNFWVYVPQDAVEADTSRIPAVLFLHGRSLSGSDLSRVRRYGTLDALEYGRKINAVVIAPQNPDGHGWKPEKVMNVLKWVEENYPVDTSRVYVLGMSMGGYGTINFTATYPDKVAAAMALCGGGGVKDYSGLNKVPMWIIHGNADRQVSWKESQKVVDKMAASDPSGKSPLLLYDIIPGADHSILARCFYLSKTYDWLFQYSLGDSTRTVDHSKYCMAQSDLKSAYSDFYGTKKKKLPVQEYRPEGNVPMETTASSEGGASSVYTIRKGDTLSAIAKRYGTSVSNLCRLNGMKETETLKIGRKIRVK